MYVKGTDSLFAKFHRPLYLRRQDEFQRDPSRALIHALASKVGTLIYTERIPSKDEPAEERCSASPVAVVVPVEEYLRLIGPKPT